MAEFEVDRQMETQIIVNEALQTRNKKRSADKENLAEVQRAIDKISEARMDTSMVTSKSRRTAKNLSIDLTGEDDV